MRRINRAYVGLSLSLLFVYGCGKSAEQKQAEQAAKSLAEAGQKMQEAMKQGGDASEAMKKMGEAMTAGKKVEPVDFRVLKSLLPESLPGLKRTNAAGERNAAFGVNISKAEGRYQADEGGASLGIDITDMGSMSGLTAMAAYGWAMHEVDSESDTGYEKTGNFGGYKSHEKYQKDSRSGEIQVLVGNRFVVEVRGDEVPMDQIKAALGKVDLAKLDGMKLQGVQ